MAMEIANIYNTYESTYAVQKAETEKVKTKENRTKRSSNEEYLKSLQKQVPYMKLQIGSAINTKNDGKVDVLDINPKLLEKMQNDPEAAKKYGQRIKDVENAHKFVDNYLKSTGSTVVCSHAYLDENGNYCNFTVSVHKDTLNEKLRKEADENAKKQIEKIRENLKKKAEELEEKIEEKEPEPSAEEMIEKKVADSKDGSFYLDDKEMQQVIQKAKEETAKKETGTYLDMKV